MGSDATTPPPANPPTVIAALNQKGIYGFDHLRLWGHFNDFLRDGLDRNVGAPFAVYLSATAHGYLALVALRKLLDHHPRAAGIDYLLRIVEGAQDELARRMEARGTRCCASIRASCINAWLITGSFLPASASAHNRCPRWSTSSSCMWTASRSGTRSVGACSSSRVG